MPFLPSLEGRGRGWVGCGRGRAQFTGQPTPNPSLPGRGENKLLPDFAAQRFEQAGDGGQFGFLLVEDGEEQCALDRGGAAGFERAGGVERGQHDVDQAFRTVQTPPQIIILAIRAAEECAKTVELDALQRRLRTTAANAGGIVRANAIDLDRVELVEAFALQQGSVATSK